MYSLNKLTLGRIRIVAIATLIAYSTILALNCKFRLLILCNLPSNLNSLFLSRDHSGSSLVSFSLCNPLVVSRRYILIFTHYAALHSLEYSSHALLISLIDKLLSCGAGITFSANTSTKRQCLLSTTSSL